MPTKHGRSIMPFIRGRENGSSRGPSDKDGASDAEITRRFPNIQISARAARPTPPAEWTFRASLLPKSVAALNHDRAMRRWMCIAFIIVVVLMTPVWIGMTLAVNNANARTDEERSVSVDLARQKARFRNVSEITEALDDIDKVNVSTLYGEIEWQKLVVGLNSALPTGASYTSLQLSEYQPATAGTGSSSSSSSSSESSQGATVWAANGVIQATFTVESPDFVSAEAFISNFHSIDGYISGDISSIVGTSGSGYTYTGTVSIDLTGNTTARSDSAANTKDDEKLLAELRKNLRNEASGTATSGTSGSSSRTADSSTTGE